MLLRRAHADAEADGDFFVAETLEDERQDLALAAGERGGFKLMDGLEPLPDKFQMRTQNVEDALGSLLLLGGESLQAKGTPVG